MLANLMIELDLVEKCEHTSSLVMYIGLLKTIQVVVSQHPGCVVDPSYVM